MLGVIFQSLGHIYVYVYIAHTSLLYGAITAFSSLKLLSNCLSFSLVAKASNGGSQAENGYFHRPECLAVAYLLLALLRHQISDHLY